MKRKTNLRTKSKAKLKTKEEISQAKKKLIRAIFGFWVFVGILIYYGIKK